MPAWWDKPFWTAFTAFFVNMLVMFGADQIVDEDVLRYPWLAAVVISLITGAAVYGKERLAQMNGTPPPTALSGGTTGE